MSWCETLNTVDDHPHELCAETRRPRNRERPATHVVCEIATPQTLAEEHEINRVGAAREFLEIFLDSVMTGEMQTSINAVAPFPIQSKNSKLSSNNYDDSFLRQKLGFCSSSFCQNNERYKIP